MISDDFGGGKLWPLLVGIEINFCYPIKYEPTDSLDDSTGCFSGPSNSVVDDPSVEKVV